MGTALGVSSVPGMTAVGGNPRNGAQANGSVNPVSGMAAVGGNPWYRPTDPKTGCGAVGTADQSAFVPGIAAVGGDT